MDDILNETEATADKKSVKNNNINIKDGKTKIEGGLVNLSLSGGSIDLDCYEIEDEVASDHTH